MPRKQYTEIISERLLTSTIRRPVENLLLALSIKLYGFSGMIRVGVVMFIMPEECRLSTVLCLLPILTIFFQVDFYAILGSEDMNIRLWKTQASTPTGVVN